VVKINFADEISKALKKYTNEVSQGIEEVKVEVAKDTVKELRKTSPKDTGDYAKGWARKKVGNAEVVHNRTDYQLTHLLEKGHAKRGGGRVAGKAHIAPAEEKAVKEFIDRVEKVIKG
jgi:Bacteriophage HK97-gp10, putative tail-component